MQLNHKLLAFYLFSVSAKKLLPERVIGAYVNRCDDEQFEKILQSVEDGLNVIFWFAGQIYCEEDNPIVTFPGEAQCRGVTLSHHAWFDRFGLGYYFVIGAFLHRFKALLQKL